MCDLGGRDSDTDDADYEVSSNHDEDDDDYEDEANQEFFDYPRGPEGQQFAVVVKVPSHQGCIPEDHLVYFHYEEDSENFFRLHKGNKALMMLIWDDGVGKWALSEEL